MKPLTFPKEACCSRKYFPLRFVIIRLARIIKAPMMIVTLVNGADMISIEMRTKTIIETEETSCGIDWEIN